MSQIDYTKMEKLKDFRNVYETCDFNVIVKYFIAPDEIYNFILKKMMNYFQIPIEEQNQYF